MMDKKEWERTLKELVDVRAEIYERLDRIESILRKADVRIAEISQRTYLKRIRRELSAGNELSEGYFGGFGATLEWLSILSQKKEYGEDAKDRLSRALEYYGFTNNGKSSEG